MLEKDEILVLPMFPQYMLTLKGEDTYYQSAIHVFLENVSTVDIYKVPVMTYSESKVKNKKWINNHLINCLRVSKFMLVDYSIMEDYPLIESISKFEEGFLDKIYNKYL